MTYALRNRQVTSEQANRQGDYGRLPADCGISVQARICFDMLIC